MRATPTGCTMKSSPDLRRCVGVVLAGEHERVFHAIAVDLHDRVGGVLGDDREEVVEQPPLGLAQLAAGDAATGVGRGNSVD